MSYFGKYKHAIIGASVPCIMFGFVEYTNPLSVLAYGAPFWIISAIILGIIYGMIGWSNKNKQTLNDQEL